MMSHPADDIIPQSVSTLVDTLLNALETTKGQI